MGFRAFSLLTIAIFLGACSDSPTPVQPEEPTPPPPPQEEAGLKKGMVGASGGTVLLSDGTGVIFPAGAVSSDMEVTVRIEDPAEYFAPDPKVERVLLRTTAPVSQFQVPVTIRVPVPAGLEQEDIFAGVVDPETGAVSVEEPTLALRDGTWFMEIETTHFSRRLWTWLRGERAPPSAGPLATPYYSQGSTNFCWAVSLHMISQAVSFKSAHDVNQIIGRLGVDEGGITAGAFRWGSAVRNLLRDRTGVAPNRATWDNVNVQIARDHLRRELGVHGRPVAVFHGGWEHAVVFVGYDGDDFFIHDPAATNRNAVGFERRSWSSILSDMKILHPFVTVSLPAPLAEGEGPVTLNLLPNALQFVQPASDPGEQSALWNFEWDHQQPTGYSVRHASLRDRGEPLPGGVQTLRNAGEILIANASRTQARDLSVHLMISAVGAPSGSGYVSYQADLTVPPNAARNFSPPPLPVDTFRYNRDEPTEYLYTLTVLGDGKTLDNRSLYFQVASVTPDLTSISPEKPTRGGQLRLQGRGFGTMPLGNQVSLGGLAVTNILSWSDTEVVVEVPESAPEEGEVFVVRGTVPSGGIAYSISNLTTIEEEFTPVSHSWGQTQVDFTGGWSLTGVGAEVQTRVSYLDNGWELLVARGTEATFEADLRVAQTPRQVTLSNGDALSYHDPVIEAIIYDSEDITLNSSVDKGAVRLDFILPKYRSFVCLRYFVRFPFTRTKADGTETEENPSSGIHPGIRLCITEAGS
jgi:hypothetical protein